MKTSKILKEARRMIEAGEETCICFCFSILRNQRKISTKQCDTLYNWVFGQLGNFIYYDSWLRTNHADFLIQMKSYMPEVEIYRQGRLAWLDYLIARQIKHEKKGKK